MQSITPVTHAQLLAAGQEPLMKLEAYVKGSWVDFGNLYSSEDLVGWWPFDEGVGATAYDKSLNLNNGTLYPTPVLISACDALTDWSGTSLSLDTLDKMEGSASIKDTVASPIVDNFYGTQYNPAGSWDWSAKKHILVWLKCDRPHTAFLSAILQVIDTSSEWVYWTLTFSAGEWTAFKLLLSDGIVGAGTVDLALVERVQVQFKAADTTPFYKKVDFLRIDDRPQWVDGIIGKALDHDGVDDFTTAALTVSPVEATVVFFVKNPATGAGPYLFRSDANTRTYIHISGGNIAFTKGDPAQNIASTPLPPADTWKCLLLKWWTIAGVHYGQAFADGVSLGAPVSFAGDAPGTYIVVAAFSSSGTQNTSGQFDEVRVYNRALTQAEITALKDLKGKSYLESVSLSLGGASMTPNPIGGTWSALLSNEDSIFHPQHPNSSYIDWLVTGRKVRASIGAKYSAVDYLWQRVIGYIDEPRFEAGNQKISVSGADYMKLLEDTQFQELDATHPNHWGGMETYSSFSSDGLVGDEIYNPSDGVPDAGDAMEIGTGEGDRVTDWTPTPEGSCVFGSYEDDEGGSTYVGRMSAVGAPPSYVKNLDVGSATEGKRYRVKFKHRGVGESGVIAIHVEILQASGRCEYLAFLPTDDWTEETFYFTALDTGVIEMRIHGAEGIEELRLDQFSIWEYKRYEERYYELAGLDPVSTGPYHVTLDSGAGHVPVQQGEEDEGWWYEEDTERVFFDLNKAVAEGTNNVDVYYFVATHPEDAVAKILYFAGLYASEELAKAAMDWDDPGFTVDKIWFKAGSTLLDAIKLLCERCDYRFYFKWDGTPVFKAKTSYSDLLTDGGLNEWLSATNLEHWLEGLAGTSTVNREATKKIEGNYSCRLDVDAGNSAVYIYQTNIPLTPLKRYKIIFWYKNSLVGKTGAIRLSDAGSNFSLKEDGTWNAGATYISLPNSLVWIPYELEFYAHASYSNYLFQLIRGDAASSSIYFDKVSIWREEFTFSDQKHLASFSNYQDKGEIKNRIIIKGLKQAEPVNRDEAVPSELIGEAHDDTSIGLYGERTLIIKNDLFQTQDSIDHVDTGMCGILLAERKDPRWYTDIEIPYNPAPIALGDLIGWKERLSPTIQIIRRGIVRDIKINGFRTTYKCEDPT